MRSKIQSSEIKRISKLDIVLVLISEKYCEITDTYNGGALNC